MDKQEEHRLFENVEQTLTPDYGNWEVREDGELLYNGTAIVKRDFKKEDLLIGANLTHILKRHWGENCKDAIDFYFAYLQALCNAGYKTLTIDLTNIHNIVIK